MKKLTLVLAVLAIVSISLFSFSKSHTPAKTEKQQVDFIWIRYGCQSYGASQPIYPPSGNYVEVFNSDMLPGTCPEMQPSGVCMVRFPRSEVTCFEGTATLRAGTNPWDGNHMIKYCTQ